jgi:hypothetical protein
MIDRRFIAGLIASETAVRYSRYPSPVGEIYLLGDSHSLKAVFYTAAITASIAIEKKFSKGETAPIASALLFLDGYFGCDFSRMTAAGIRSGK